MAEFSVADKLLRGKLTSYTSTHAAGIVAAQAESIALEIDRGFLPKCDGPTALRLFAALLRTCNVMV